MKLPKVSITLPSSQKMQKDTSTSLPSSVRVGRKDSTTTPQYPGKCSKNTRRDLLFSVDALDRSFSVRLWEASSSSESTRLLSVQWKSPAGLKLCSVLTTSSKSRRSLSLI